MRTKSVVISVVLILLGGCGDDRVAGRGVASETTNGTVVSGVVRAPSGAPAARARVEMRDPASGILVAFDSTDGEGAWALLVPRAGRFVISSRTSNEGVLAWVSVGERATTVGDLVQSGLRPLNGRVGGISDGGALLVRLPGLGLETAVAPDSSWSFPAVPEGVHLVWVESSTLGLVGEAVASVWRSDTIGLQAAPSILLDAFEGPEGQSLLQPILDGAWWGRWNDTSMLADSSRTWAGTSGLSTDSTSWSGRSLRVPLLVGDTIATRPDLQRSAGLQLKLGGDEAADSASVWHDLSLIDSIVFLAKGAGSLTFQIKARPRGAPASTDWLKAAFVLTPNWSRFVLRPTDFSSAEGLSWSSAQARDILWVSRDSVADLWLDDIRLHGPRLTDLLRR